MDCDIRHQLSSRYNLSLRACAIFEETLRLNHETASASEYRKMKVSADESRIEAELARLELESHIKQHKCGHGPE
jgi:hypothetical protein